MGLQLKSQKNKNKNKISNNANPNPPTLDVGLNPKSQTMQIQIPQLWMWGLNPKSQTLQIQMAPTLSTNQSLEGSPYQISVISILNQLK